MKRNSESSTTLCCTCGEKISVSIPELKYRSISPTTHAKALPQPKPWAIRQHLVMSSVRSRDIVYAEWPDLRRLEDFLKLLDVVNDAFNVHRQRYSELA
jgi:hypothetical protein